MINNLEYNKELFQCLDESIWTLIDMTIHSINCLASNKPYKKTELYELEVFPNCYIHKYDIPFLKQFMDILMMLHFKLMDKKVYWNLSSVIEEITMWAILNETECIVEMDYDYEIDFEEIREEIYLDHDFLLLYDSRLDGIQDNKEFTRENSIVNLKFEDWFAPFNLDFGIANEDIQEIESISEEAEELIFTVTLDNPKYEYKFPNDENDVSFVEGSCSVVNIDKIEITYIEKPEKEEPMTFIESLVPDSILNIYAYRNDELIAKDFVFDFHEKKSLSFYRVMENQYTFELK